MSQKRKKINQQQPAYAIPGYKGFNRDLTCRGFQFKEGETFIHDGKAKACDSGFHFCGNPIDVFSYYAPGEAVFHQVAGSGDVDLSHADDSKIACTEIQIGASLSLHDMITAGISFFFSRKYEEKGSQHSEGPSSASSATGDSSASSATGDASAAVATGLYSKVMAGKYGVVALAWWNKKERRCEMRCAETGCGDGSDGKLKANVWYQLNDQGEFVEVPE